MLPALLLYLFITHVCPAAASVCQQVPVRSALESGNVLIQRRHLFQSASKALPTSVKLLEASGPPAPTTRAKIPTTLTQRPTTRAKIPATKKKDQIADKPRSLLATSLRTPTSFNISQNAITSHRTVQKDVHSSAWHPISSLQHKKTNEGKRWSEKSPSRWKGDADHTGTQCWEVDYEYGNQEKGSCDTANLAAIHCKKSCLQEVRDQDWFQQNLPTREVEYTAAEECREACLQTAACEFWVFDTRPGTYENACWMKEAVHCASPFGDAPGFISGPAQCDTLASTRLEHVNTKHLVASPTRVKTHITLQKSGVEKSYRHATKSSWGPWLLRFLFFVAELAAGGACCFGAASLAIWRYTKASEKAEVPVCEEPRMSYRMQAVCKGAGRSKQLADTLKNFAAPGAPHQEPEPECGSFASSSKEAAEGAHAAAYDY